MILIYKVKSPNLKKKLQRRRCENLKIGGSRIFEIFLKIFFPKRATKKEEK